MSKRPPAPRQNVTSKSYMDVPYYGPNQLLIPLCTVVAMEICCEFTKHHW